MPSLSQLDRREAIAHATVMGIVLFVMPFATLPVLTLILDTPRESVPRWIAELAGIAVALATIITASLLLSRSDKTRGVPVFGKIRPGIDLATCLGPLAISLGAGLIIGTLVGPTLRDLQVPEALVYGDSPPAPPVVEDPFHNPTRRYFALRNGEWYELTPSDTEEPIDPPTSEDLLRMGASFGTNTLIAANLLLWAFTFVLAECAVFLAALHRATRSRAAALAMLAACWFSVGIAGGITGMLVIASTTLAFGGAYLMSGRAWGPFVGFCVYNLIFTPFV